MLIYLLKFFRNCSYKFCPNYHVQRINTKRIRKILCRVASTIIWSTGKSSDKKNYYTCYTNKSEKNSTEFEKKKTEYKMIQKYVMDASSCKNRFKLHKIVCQSFLLPSWFLITLDIYTDFYFRIGMLYVSQWYLWSAVFVV